MGAFGRIPFSVFDVFAYLAPGFIVIASVDYTYNEHWILSSHLDVSSGLLWSGAAYVVGQIVANLAGWLYERVIIRMWLDPPSVLLFDDATHPVLSRIFPGYYTRLPQVITDSVRTRANLPSTSEPEALFQRAYAAVRTKQVIANKLDIFVTQYDFARNTSLACLIAAAVLVWSAVPVNPAAWLWFWASIASAVGLLYRYLKYYRQYSYEVFINYAALG